MVKIGAKIISGEISYHKARALLPLMGDVTTTVVTSRSNRYFFELQRLAEEMPLVGDVSTTVDTSRTNRYFVELQRLF